MVGVVFLLLYGRVQGPDPRVCFTGSRQVQGPRPAEGGVSGSGGTP